MLGKILKELRMKVKIVESTERLTEECALGESQRRLGK